MSEMCSVCIVRAQRDDDDFLPCSPACFWAALRACEQRVAEETEKAMMEFFYWKPSPPHDKHYFADNICAYCVGYREALSAALRALYAMQNVGGYPEFDFDHIRDDFRDVIDSLKEKP